MVFEALPHLREAYSEQSGRKMALFTLEDAEANILDMDGNAEKIF